MVVLTENLLLSIRMASLALYISESFAMQWANWPSLVEGVSFGSLYMRLAARQCIASRAAKLCLCTQPPKQVVREL